MGDPGLNAGKEAVDIPVLGIGQTSMNYAKNLGDKFSILPTLERRIISFVLEVRCAQLPLVG
jgi:Asp/Glu/hydantoin racemase